jgi:hypothetical protein
VRAKAGSDKGRNAPRRNGAGCILNYHEPVSQPLIAAMQAGSVLRIVQIGGSAGNPRGRDRGCDPGTPLCRCVRG